MNISVAARASFLAACAVIAMCSAGCGGGRVITIHNQAEFDQTVRRTDKPVFVTFNKAGCTMCAIFEPTIDKLSKEYEGRVVFANYQIMSLLFDVTNPEVQTRYDVAVYPTVVLFVDGAASRKWVSHYNINDYRKAIDWALANQATQPPAKPEPPPATRKK